MTLWEWAIQQREAAENPPPAQIHVGHKVYPRDTSPPRRRSTVVGAPPFTAAFEAYIIGHSSLAPIEIAMLSLYSPRVRAQSLEFEIAWAVIKGGHSDPETLRGLLGCSEQAFNGARDRGLRIVREKTLLLISERQKRNEPTVKAGTP